MEFYELNRLYDESLNYIYLSKTLDSYLYLILPIILSFGCGISVLYIIVLSRPALNLASKNYLLTQAIFNFLFQIITSIIFLTNYYERILLSNYFSYNKFIYLNLKAIINFFYNINLYCIIWLFIIGALNTCVITILKYHLNSNYNKLFKQTFDYQRTQLSNQVKLLEKLKKYKNKKEQPQQSQPQLQQQTSQYLSTPNNLNRAKSVSKGSNLNLNNSNDETFLNTSSYNINSNENNATDFDSFEITNTNDALNNNNNIYGMGVSNTGLDNTQLDAEIEETSFCKPNTIFYAIVTIAVLAVLLAFPQIFAHEIKQNLVTITPTPLPSSFLANNENLIVYYIPQDQELDIINKNKISYDFTSNIGQAYAISVKLGQDKESKSVFNLMRKTHSSFFTQSGYYDLASREYHFCNIVKNNKPSRTRLLKSNAATSTKRIKKNINTSKTLFANLTISCIKKGSLLSYLTYNTLYFWLEHTMVISVPVSISFVMFITIVNTCFKFSKLVKQQDRIRAKRKKLFKLQERNSTSYHEYKKYLNYYLNESEILKSLRAKMKKSKLNSVTSNSSSSKYNMENNSAYPFNPNDLSAYYETQMQKADDNMYNLGVHSYGANDEYLQQTYYYYYQQQQLRQQQQQQQQSKAKKKVNKQNADQKQEAEAAKQQQQQQAQPTTPTRVMTVKYDLNTNSATGEQEVIDDNESLIESEYLNSFNTELEETLMERKIKMRQEEDQALNKLLIYDLLFYFVLSLPYTMLRLVLDLFVKERNKVSLDFLMLYKLALILFHIHLIAKFFLMLVYCVKFRICLIRTFSLSPGMCCISDEQINSYNSSRIKIDEPYAYKMPFLYIICCFFCRHCCLSRIFGQYFKEPYGYNMNMNFGNTSLIKANYGKNPEFASDETNHSTEFNSNFHQYFHPADPDHSDVFLQSHSNHSKNNMI